MWKCFLTTTTWASVKICEICGRKLKGKRWIETTPQDIAKSRLMENLETTKCQECLRHAESHVAKLQVRGRFNRKDIENIIWEKLKSINKGGRMENVFFKNGDYYFTNKNLMKSISHRLREAGAEIKETSKVVTHDRLRSVPLTRLIVSARFQVLVGDVVKVTAGLDVVTKVLKSWVWTRNGEKLRVKNTTVIEVDRLEGLIISEKPPMVLVKDNNETLEVAHLVGKIGDETTVLRKGNFITTV